MGRTLSQYCAFAAANPVHAAYHDTEYGVASADEAVLFERLCLEIFQAGLSWDLILRRRAGIRVALMGFDVDRVAALDADGQAALLADPRIIRNRLKIAAIAENARRIQALRHSHGGFAGWLDAHHPAEKPAWIRLFRRQFLFTGGEITGEFLMSLGYLPGAHAPDCPTGMALAAAGHGQRVALG